MNTRTVKFVAAPLSIALLIGGAVTTPATADITGNVFAPVNNTIVTGATISYGTPVEVSGTYTVKVTSSVAGATYQLIGAPEWVTIDPQTGTLTANPQASGVSGIKTVLVQVTVNGVSSYVTVDFNFGSSVINANTTVTPGLVYTSAQVGNTGAITVTPNITSTNTNIVSEVLINGVSTPISQSGVTINSGSNIVISNNTVGTYTIPVQDQQTGQIVVVNVEKPAPEQDVQITSRTVTVQTQSPQQTVIPTKPVEYLTGDDQRGSFTPTQPNTGIGGDQIANDQTVPEGGSTPDNTSSELPPLCLPTILGVTLPLLVLLPLGLLSNVQLPGLTNADAFSRAMKEWNNSLQRQFGIWNENTSRGVEAVQIGTGTWWANNSRLIGTALGATAYLGFAAAALADNCSPNGVFKPGETEAWLSSNLSSQQIADWKANQTATNNTAPATEGSSTNTGANAGANQ